jgi:hypothetical protein
MKSWWAGHVARMDEMRGAQRILKGRNHLETHLRRKKRRWKLELVLYFRRRIVDAKNCQLRWPLQVDTWEGGEDLKTIAHREREPNPFLVLCDVKQVQAAEVAQRRTAMSSKCFQLYYTCSDRLFAIMLLLSRSILFSLLLWRFRSSQLFCVHCTEEWSLGFMLCRRYWLDLNGQHHSPVATPQHSRAIEPQPVPAGNDMRCVSGWDTPIAWSVRHCTGSPTSSGSMAYGKLEER